MSLPLLRRPPILLCLWSACAGAADAPTPPTLPTLPETPAAPLQQVQISGASAQLQRRNDTAARIVVEHAELTQYGDSSLTAALKRQPGIAIGSNGELRMRGLGNGYTQLLINGEPAPAGFALDALAPELIERVEILRSASAEYSSQAIAGSINVILKKNVSRARTELKAALAREQGRPLTSATLQLADRRAGLSYALAATLSRGGSDNRERIEEQSEGSGPASLRRFDEHFQADIDKASLAPRLNWQLANGDTLSWQGLFDLLRATSWGGSNEQTLAGASSAYPVSTARNSARTEAARSDLSWQHRIGEDASLNVKLGLNHNRRNSDYVFHGTDAGGQERLVRSVASDALDDSASASGKYLNRVLARHSLAFGWDGSYTRRSEQRLQHDRDPAGVTLGRLDADYLARVRRLALFAQDEWDLSERLQAYLGLRWEGLATSTSGPTLSEVAHRSSVPSPVMQLLWKPSGPDGGQLRLALARTYKAPLTRNLVPRRYTTNNDNGPTNPDVRGNPALRPELARGLDLAYERYFGTGGVFSLSAYARQIDDVTVQRLFQQGASWVRTPSNGGRASARGVEFDARLPLRHWLAGAPALELRLNAARNWSRLEALAGPDNRLAEQVPLTANAGFDYRPSDASACGASLNLQTGGPARLTQELRSSSGVSRTLDLYASWRPAPGSQWRLSLSNVLHQDSNGALSYRDSAFSTERRSSSPTSTGLRLQYERTL